jgi:integrase
MAPRQKRGTGSVRKLPNDRYQARITGPETKRYPLGTFGTKRAAELAIAKESSLMENDPEGWRPPRERAQVAATERARALAAAVTFSEYAADFLRTRVVGGQPLQPSTKKRYSELLAKYINPTFGDLSLDQISPSLVATWWDALPESPKIRREAYTLARAVMTQATSVHGPLPGGSVAFQIRGAGTGVSPKRETTVTGPELKIILATIRPEWRLMVLLALWCGMRFGELAALRRRDIDLKEGVIRIRRSLGLAGSAEKHVKAPKSAAGVRDQRIPATILPELRDHLAARMQELDGLVFPSPNGGHLNPSVFYGKPRFAPKKPKPAPVPGGWFAARSAADRPDLRFHDLRATGATLLAQSGASIAEVMEFLGDSTPTAAMRYVRSRSTRMDALTGHLSDLAEGGHW